MAKSLSVRTKLSLLVALPLIPLLILAGISIHQKQAARSQAQDLRTLMSFATGIGSLAHDLQAERGMTVGFLSSRGARFAETLKNQQAQTDASISRLEAQLGDVLAAVTDKELRGSISATRQAERMIEAYQTLLASEGVPGSRKGEEPVRGEQEYSS